MAARKRAEAVGASVLEEGQEEDAFWDLLGGQGEYMTEKLLNRPGGRAPRLFHGSNASGNFKLEEVLHFTQSDLGRRDKTYTMYITWLSIFMFQCETDWQNN